MSDLELLKQLEHIIPLTTDKILNKFFNHTTAQLKTDGSIVTEADVAMQEVLKLELNKIAPDVQMLGEEMSLQHQNEVIQNSQSYWCLDPVDGTNNFHHGVPLFSRLLLNIASDVSVVLIPPASAKSRVPAA